MYVQVKDGVFTVNLLKQRTVVANADHTIVFDQSDSSNAGHPLVIALYADGHHNTGGNEYTIGVTKNGTPGQPGANTTFVLNDQTLNGTYYYYCQNHAGMGGMIHFGADTDSNDNIVGYPVIDEGATAYDAQDGDITSSIKKIVEVYDASLDPPWGLLYDSNLSLSPHTNPWKIQGTDTRESARYRVRYNVTDSGGLSAPPRTKIFNIGGVNQTTGLLTIEEPWNVSVGFGVWGWYGMIGLTQGPTPASSENNDNRSVINSASLAGFVAGTTGSSISLEVPLNTWIMIYAEGQYEALSTGGIPSYYSYWCGNPYYEHWQRGWQPDASRREQMIVDADYENGNENSRIRFPGPSITDWSEYDANFLYPPGTVHNGGSINVHAFKGFNGEYERWTLQHNQSNFFRHTLDNNWNMAVFKILDSVTVNLNFYNVYYGL